MTGLQIESLHRQNTGTFHEKEKGININARAMRRTSVGGKKL